MVKDIFEFTVKENVDMRVQSVSSEYNNTDGESRRVTLSDSQLSPGIWNAMEEFFGLHYEPHVS